MFNKKIIQEEQIEGIIQRCGFLPSSEYNTYFIFTIKGFTNFFILKLHGSYNNMFDCALTKPEDLVSFKFNKDFLNQKRIELISFHNITFNESFTKNNNFDKSINIMK